MGTKWVVDYRLWRINKHEAYGIMSKASKTSLECQGSISVKTFQDLFGMSENGTNTFFSLQLQLFLIVPTHTSANASYRTGPPHYNASAKLSTLRLNWTPVLHKVNKLPQKRQILVRLYASISTVSKISLQNKCIVLKRTCLQFRFRYHRLTPKASTQQTFA